MRNVLFKLTAINTEQFATVEKSLADDAVNNVAFGLGVSFGINAKEHFVACFLDINYKLDNELIVILKMNAEFQVESESWQKLLDSKTQKVVLPKTFLHHLASITVGTARGIIHTKTENTPYHRFVLPTINLEDIISKDEAFQL